MKCVTIVYRRPKPDQFAIEFKPVRPLKRSVDQYIEKLKEKEQQNNFMAKTSTKKFRLSNGTAQTSRQHRINQQPEISESINVVRLKYSTDNLFRRQIQSPHTEAKLKTQRKFRSTFIKRKQSITFYTLKGIKPLHSQSSPQKSESPSPKKGEQIIAKNSSKLLCLKKIKPLKTNTVLISIDFILNQFNFWQQQNIDESVHKNWKLLQQHSNVVWITRRQNSLKKLEKYAADFGLRLDGVYKIVPNKRIQTLFVSLTNLEKDLLIQAGKKEDIRKELIVINSLRLETLKDVGFQEFYSAFPVSKTFSCIVHFIQVEMNDKNRFNSPLKVLSKQKLPQPNPINHLFISYHKNHSTGLDEVKQLYYEDLQGNLFEDQDVDEISNQEMMQIYEDLKEKFINYFGNHLKISLNHKVKIDGNEASVQFVIGDMLKRNFRIMLNYHQESRKINGKLKKLQQKQLKESKINETNTSSNAISLFQNNLIKPQLKISMDQLLNSKLINTRKLQSKQKPLNYLSQQQKYYKQPVFLWKK